MLKRTHKCGEVGIEHVGQSVVVSGWVARRRDHGGLIFVDVRDRYGLVQVAFNPERNKQAHDRAAELRLEYCISVLGEVARRPEGMANPQMATGQVEVLADELEVHSISQTPPFEVNGTAEVSTEVRMRYRYLDLRRPHVQAGLMFRHRLMQLTRRFFDAEGFVEVETPFLTKSTPEGARDYLVPSRANPGTFYALPQSPQLFKQILMVSGLDRYFQIVKCFRDEDLRAQRQPEFTQIDVEMSFVEEQDVMDCAERLMARAFSELMSREITLPLARLSYAEAMARYGTDAPDLRFGLEIGDVTDIVRSCAFTVFRKAVEEHGEVRGIAVPGGASLPRSEIDGLTEWIKQFGAGGLAWFKLADGGPRGGIAKFLTEGEVAAIAALFGASEGDLLLFVADQKQVCDLALSHLRLHLARKLNLVPQDVFNLCWIVEAPLFELDQRGGGLVFVHHPFTAPSEADVGRLESDPASVCSRAYDLVMNGVELGGGSIRISAPELQMRVLEVLGIPRREAQDRFGFFLNALRYGPPPHGGIALGLDRLVAAMLQLEDIREIIAFPKTQRAICLLTDAPSEVSPEQLKELGISLRR